MDALQVTVRGFNDTFTADRIVEVLEGVGFGIETAFAGKFDSLGGIIETTITRVEQLSGSVWDIRRGVYACDPANPGIFIQVDTYKRVRRYQRGKR